MNMMFDRWVELPDKTLLLLGPRRAGKTTLLRKYLPGFTYLTLDDFDVLQAAQRDPKGLLSGYDRLIIDEVQRVPHLLIAVKNVVDNHGARVLMTGSSSMGLDAHGVETLAGRVQRLELPTLCWGESKGASTHDWPNLPSDPLQAFEAQRGLSLAMRYGGFPEVVGASSNDERSEILKMYRDSYFTRDLLLLSNIENANALMAIMNYLAISIGTPIAVSHMAKEAGVSVPTAKKYLNVLLASRLVFSVMGYHYGAAKRFTRAKKYYFADSGILHAIDAQVSVGQAFENFVVGEIEKRRKLKRLKCAPLYYYKTTSGAEIDLVLESEDGVSLYEIKHGQSVHRSDIRNVRDFESKTPRVQVLGRNIIYGGDKVYQEQGVRMLPVTTLYRG